MGSRCTQVMVEYMLPPSPRPPGRGRAERLASLGAGAKPQLGEYLSLRMTGEGSPELLMLRALCAESPFGFQERQHATVQLLKPALYWGQLRSGGREQTLKV